MVSHSRIYLEQLKNCILYPITHNWRPLHICLFASRGLFQKVFGSHVIQRESQMPAPFSITQHHPLYSIQITVQTITQVQLAKALITKRKCVKDIE